MSSYTIPIKYYILLASVVFFVGVAAGETGYALDFDGQSDLVNVGDYNELDLQNEISISVWFKLDGRSSDNNWPRIISKGQSTTEDGAYGIYVRDSSDPHSIGFRIMDSSGSQVDPVRSASVNYGDGEWHHVVVTFSNKDENSSLYFDGNLKNQSSISGNLEIDVTEDSLLIGAADNNAERYFNGDLDDVRIYNDSLYARDVQKLYEQRYRDDVAPEQKVGWWPMNEGEGNTLVDKSGSDNNGSIEGAKWIDSGVEVLQICDRRGAANECIAEDEHDISSKHFRISSIFQVKDTAVLKALDDTATINVDNSTFLSGFWRGSFNISTPKQEKTTIKPGAEFRPENGRIVVGN